MKLAKDEVVAALRLRYDHYSAQTMFDSARALAGLDEQTAYDVREVAAFRAALATIGDRLATVEARFEALLEAEPELATTPKPEPEPEPKPEPPARAAPDPQPPPSAPPAATRAPSPSNVAAPTVHIPPVTTAAPAVETTIILAGLDVAKDELVMMCGGAAELGDWEPAQAREMTRDGDLWRATIKLASGIDIAFKFLRSKADRSVEWEAGGNRNLVAGSRLNATWRPAAEP